MPYESMTSESETVLLSKVTDSSAAVKRYINVCIGRTVCNDSSIRLCLVFALDSVVILEDDACDTAVVYCTAVEDITYAEVVGEFVLETLACGSCKSVHI